jgi:beta propeller repeat protein
MSIPARYSRKLVVVLSVLLSSILVVICIRPAFSRWLGHRIIEFQITTSSEIDYNPDIDGNIVVWRTGRDIHGYDLLSGNYFVVSAEKSYETYPRVSGDWVVWIDDRESVFAKNLETGEKRTIVSETCTDHCLYSLDISGDFIVWADGDVWLYHIPTQVITQVTSDYPVDLGYQDYPAVGPPWVVWRNQDKGAHIRGYDIDTTEIVTLTTGLGTGNEDFPDVSNGILVWQGSTYPPMGGTNIFGMDLTTRELFTVTYNSDFNWGPRTDGDTVVWTAYSEGGGHCDVLAYDIATGHIISVTSPATSDDSPSVSGCVVVWKRYDNPPDDWNIYGAHMCMNSIFLPLVLRDEDPMCQSAYRGQAGGAVDE